MKRTLIILTVSVLGLLAVAPVAAQDKPADKASKSAVALIDFDRIDEAERQQITFLLSGYHSFPDRAKLEATSSDAANILMAISTDTTLKPSLRVQATRALAWFEDDSKVASFFELQLENDKLDDTMLRHTIIASLRGFGERALPWVERHLGHSDVSVRLVAVSSIGQLGGENGRLMLRARHDFERDGVVKEKMNQLIRR